MVQVESPAEAEYMPAAQDVQEVSPLATWYLPAAQVEQEVAPAAEYWPAAQLPQAVVEVEVEAAV